MIDPASFDSEVERAWQEFPPPEVYLDDVEACRAAYGAYFRGRRARSAPPDSTVRTEDVSVQSRVDGAAVPLRIYRPAAPVEGRALLYLHAGSFVLGDLELEDRRCRTLASDAGCVVVAVDYRLAPEHPFPTPLDDCESALRWVVDHAAELLIDVERISVGGCSAGAALAASLALACRDRGGPALALQLLLYPVLDASRSSASMRALLTDEGLQDMERMWMHYLAGPTSSAPTLASPASHPSLDGLPPAYVCAAELDPLRDEAVRYAQRLLAAGVGVELHVWPKVPHAVDLFVPDAQISRVTVAEQAAALVRLSS